MSIKPGQSYQKMKAIELEKGIVGDALAGASLVASLAAVSAAHRENRGIDPHHTVAPPVEYSEHQNHIQMQQEFEPEHPKAAKVEALRSKLNAIRAKIPRK